MRRVEERAELLGVSRTLLMENAGSAVARYVREKFGDLGGKDIVVICGTGNNGGDGFVAARHLAPYGAKILVILLGRPEEIRTFEASSNWKILERMRSVETSLAPEKGRLVSLRGRVVMADVLIDAIFGTGIEGTIREPHSTAIDLVNESKAYKVAVDIPSGLDPKTGGVHDKAVKADVTITFHKLKPGLLGRKEFTGEVRVEPIGVPPEAGSPEGALA